MQSQAPGTAARVVPWPRAMADAETKPSAGRRRSLLAVLLFLSVSALISYHTLIGLNVPGNPQAPAWGLQDFRDAIYYPVVAFLEGKNPYDPAEFARSYPVGNTFPLYLPLALVLHLPFGLMPFTMSEVVYMLTNVALTPLIAFLSLRLSGLRASAAAMFGVASLILLSRPGYWSLFIGQCTATVVVGTYAALYFARSRPCLAGLAVAVSSFKPTFGVPLAILMLARGDLRAVLIGLGLSALVSAGAAGIIARDIGGITAFVASLYASHAGFNADPEVNPATATYRVDAVAFVSRLVGHPLPGVVDLVVFVAVLGFAAVAIRRLAQCKNGVVSDPSIRLSNGITCVALLACTYHQTYDLLLLAMPLTAVATGRWSPAAGGAPWGRGVLLLALALLASNYLVSGTAMSRLGITGSWRIAVTSLNGGALLVALSIYLGHGFWYASPSSKPAACLSTTASGLAARTE